MEINKFLKSIHSYNLIPRQMSKLDSKIIDTNIRSKIENKTYNQNSSSLYDNYYKTMATIYEVSYKNNDLSADTITSIARTVDLYTDIGYSFHRNIVARAILLVDKSNWIGNKPRIRRVIEDVQEISWTLLEIILIRYSLIKNESSPLELVWSKDKNIFTKSGADRYSLLSYSQSGIFEMNGNMNTTYLQKVTTDNEVIKVLSHKWGITTEQAVRISKFCSYYLIEQDICEIVYESALGVGKEFKPFK